MFPAKTQTGSQKTVSRDRDASISSQAFEWIWQYLQDVEKPHVLDCGAVSSAAVRAFVERGAKVYVADLLAPLQRSDAAFWRLDEKERTFCLDTLLVLLPRIPAASLQLICCWHLLDLIPGDQLPRLLTTLLGYLEKGGILHCFLREQNLKTGKDGRWWHESLTTLGAEGAEKGAFLYPPVSNREMERLTEGFSVKTFLTRSHRREVVVLKKGD